MARPPRSPRRLPRKAAGRASKATADAPQTAAPASREKKATRARKGEAEAEHQPRAGTNLEQFVKLLRPSRKLRKCSTGCSTRCAARSRRAQEDVPPDDLLGEGRRPRHGLPPQGLMGSP